MICSDKNETLIYDLFEKNNQAVYLKCGLGREKVVVLYNSLLCGREASLFTRLLVSSGLFVTWISLKELIGHKSETY